MIHKTLEVLKKIIIVDDAVIATKSNHSDKNINLYFIHLLLYLPRPLPYLAVIALSEIPYPFVPAIDS